MRWPWKKLAPLPAIPPHRPEIQPPQKPAEPSIIVEEHDIGDVDITELQSRTGMQRVFDRVTGKFKG